MTTTHKDGNSFVFHFFRGSGFESSLWTSIFGYSGSSKDNSKWTIFYTLKNGLVYTARSILWKVAGTRFKLIQLRRAYPSPTLYSCEWLNYCLWVLIMLRSGLIDSAISINIFATCSCERISDEAWKYGCSSLQIWVRIHSDREYLLRLERLCYIPPSLRPPSASKMRPCSQGQMRRYEMLEVSCKI